MRSLYKKWGPALLCTFGLAAQTSAIDAETSVVMNQSSTNTISIDLTNYFSRCTDCPKPAINTTELLINLDSENNYSDDSFEKQFDLNISYDPISEISRQQYVDFPEAVNKLAPIVAPAIEDGLNRLIKRRLKRTYRHYQDAEEYNRMVEQYETVDSKTLGNNSLSPYINSAVAHRQWNRFIRPDNRFRPSFYHMPDYTIVNDETSVLEHYEHAERSPNVRFKGELRYKGGNFIWRVGGQKERVEQFSSLNTSEQRRSIYSTLNIDLSDQFNYFGYFAKDQYENLAGVEDAEHTGYLRYHKLNYSLTDNTDIYAAYAQDTLFGTESREGLNIGVKHCDTFQKHWSLCGVTYYQDTDYHSISNEGTLHKARSDHGIKFAATVQYKF